MEREGHTISDLAKDHTAQGARKSMQPSKLHFVNVAVRPSRAHFPVREAEAESSIRSHVMKDYLQQKQRLSKPRNPPQATPSLSDHLTQFRLPAAPDRGVSRQRTKKVKTDERSYDSSSRPPKRRAIMPEARGNLQEIGSVLAISLANSLPFSILSPIDLSVLSTSALLEYYHTSYWDNSLAVNPEGQWIAVAISDAAMLHATLCLVSLHKCQTHEEPLADSYFWHRGEAMRLISRNLADPEQATSDATVGAVAVLSASDNSIHWPSNTQTSHMEGLITLVRLRGGLDGMNTNRHIKRVTAWADILHATAHNSTPQFQVTQYSAHREMERLLDIIRKHTDSMVSEDDFVPGYFRDVWKDLRALAMAKSLLTKKEFQSVQELRQIFSNLLFVTEHRILELGKTAPSSRSMTGNASAIEAAKAAALIFTIHGLRDLAITAAFYDSLVRRLRDGLCSVFNDGYHEQNTTNTSHEIVSETFLLWLCVTGWKASATKSRQTERRSFVEKATVLCESLKIDSLTDLCSQISNIILLTDYHQSACSRLWADIRSWTTLSDSIWMANQRQIPVDDEAGLAIEQI